MLIDGNEGARCTAGGRESRGVCGPASAVVMSMIWRAQLGVPAKVLFPAHSWTTKRLPKRRAGLQSFDITVREIIYCSPTVVIFSLLQPRRRP